jgi:hypothetical protein
MEFPSALTIPAGKAENRGSPLPPGVTVPTTEPSANIRPILAVPLKQVWANNLPKLCARHREVLPFINDSVCQQEGSGRPWGNDRSQVWLGSGIKVGHGRPDPSIQHGIGHGCSASHIQKVYLSDPVRQTPPQHVASPRQEQALRPLKPERVPSDVASPKPETRN